MGKGIAFVGLDEAAYPRRFFFVGCVLVLCSFYPLCDRNDFYEVCVPRGGASESLIRAAAQLSVAKAGVSCM